MKDRAQCGLLPVERALEELLQRGRICYRAGKRMAVVGFQPGLTIVIRLDPATE